jgi:hypothetical protein
MDYLSPIPDPEGIAKTKDLYLNRFGMALTDEQAADVLGRAMRFIYLTSKLCSPMLSMPENPKKMKSTAPLSQSKTS